MTFNLLLTFATCNRHFIKAQIVAYKTSWSSSKPPLPPAALQIPTSSITTSISLLSSPIGSSVITSHHLHAQNISVQETLPWSIVIIQCCNCIAQVVALLMFVVFPCSSQGKNSNRKIFSSSMYLSYDSDEDTYPILMKTLAPLALYSFT